MENHLAHEHEERDAQQDEVRTCLHGHHDGLLQHAVQTCHQRQTHSGDGTKGKGDRDPHDQQENHACKTVESD